MGARSQGRDFFACLLGRFARLSKPGLAGVNGERATTARRRVLRTFPAWRVDESGEIQWDRREQPLTGIPAGQGLFSVLVAGGGFELRSFREQTYGPTNGDVVTRCNVHFGASMAMRR